MSACARSCQRPPRSRASASRTSSQTCSESTSTPSRSNTTASISLTRSCTRRERARAPVRPPPARPAAPRRRRTCASPRRPPAEPSTRASRWRRRAAARRCAPASMPTLCHIAIGGTPRAKCCASHSCPAASIETAQPPASRSSSCIAASLRHREADERRAQRERDERADGEPELLLAGRDGDDANARRMTAEERAEVAQGRPSARDAP